MPDIILAYVGANMISKGQFHPFYVPYVPMW